MNCKEASVCMLVGSIDNEESIRLDKWKKLIEKIGHQTYLLLELIKQIFKK